MARLNTPSLPMAFASCKFAKYGGYWNKVETRLLGPNKYTRLPCETCRWLLSQGYATLEYWVTINIASEDPIWPEYKEILEKRLKCAKGYPMEPLPFTLPLLL